MFFSGICVVFIENFIREGNCKLQGLHGLLVHLRPTIRFTLKPTITLPGEDTVI